MDDIDRRTKNKMDIHKLRKKLIREGIDINCCSLNKQDDSVSLSKDGTFIREQDGRWLVYVMERGIRYPETERLFDREDDACYYYLGMMISGTSPEFRDFPD